MGWLAGHVGRRVDAVRVALRAGRTPPARSSAHRPAAGTPRRPAARSHSPRPRTSSAPCSATAARSASRCSAAQPTGSSAAVRRMAGAAGAAVQVGGLSRRTCRSPSPVACQSGNGAASAVRACRPSRSSARSASTGVTGDVLRGHRPAQGDGQLHRRQRRTAPLEEVVAPSDLVVRHAEHLRPCGRQPPLGRRLWRGILRGRGELAGQTRQRRPVDLAVRGQRQGLAPVQGRGDHVLRQRLGQPVPQEPVAERPRTGVEADQLRARSAPSATIAAPSRTPGTRSRAFSTSPISIRNPRILTWLSWRPRKSRVPSGCQRPWSPVRQIRCPGRCGSARRPRRCARGR